ncbi:MAG: hypothetical protein OEY88_02565 [Candidatus Bathyarchaeota archaeon]|nr:hypothetical protein [Candidatus Bathyarchaeota archaeon]
MKTEGVPGKVQRVPKTFDGHTQPTRGQLILDLKVIQELRSDQAIDTHPKSGRKNRTGLTKPSLLNQDEKNVQTLHQMRAVSG